MDFLYLGPTDAKTTLVLAHGAGGAMDTPWMTQVCELLGDRGIRTARFEFAYMAGRRSGVRKPAPRAETIMNEYVDAVAATERSGSQLLIGGKSMGGRIASMVADELLDAGSIDGVVCLGYPFHPPGKPEKVRTAHLESLRTPTLICQGTRDVFGTAEDVAGYTLSPTIEVHWVDDGDHSLQPRKGITGRNLSDALTEVAVTIEGFAARL